MALKYLAKKIKKTKQKLTNKTNKQTKHKRTKKQNKIQTKRIKNMQILNAAMQNNPKHKKKQ